MSLSVKILEFQESPLAITKHGWLGGIITSETVGYTGVNGTVAHTPTGNPYWLVTGNAASTYCEMQYTSAIACANLKQIYVTAVMSTPESGMDSFDLVVYGTTGGGEVFATQLTPSDGSEYIVSGHVNLDVTYSGNVVIGWRMADAGGTNTKTFTVRQWTAIDVSEEFGAGEVGDSAFDSFFAWRWELMTQKNYGLYQANGKGDCFYFASKIAGHGLEYNDVVSPDGSYFSCVYPLNADWVITSCFWNPFIDFTGIDDITGVTDATEFYYWIKTDYTSRLLSKSLQMNMREDIDGSVKLAFRADSTWQPLSGMTVVFYDDTETLFTGHITHIEKTKLSPGASGTNWRCDCVVSSLLHTLTWNVASEPTAWINLYGGATTAQTSREMIQYLLMKFAGPWSATDHAGQGIWIGNIDIGNTITPLTDLSHKTVYELANSFCASSGFAITISGDRRIKVQYLSNDMEYAPSGCEATDADNPDIWDIKYSEDMSGYGNEVVMRGGYDADGAQVIGYVTGTGEISINTYAGNPNKALILSDSTVTNTTDAEAAGALYLERFGEAIPGELSFTTSILTYRPGQQIQIDIASLGISSKYAYIDEVTIYDADGKNLLANVKATVRPSGNFSWVPSPSATSYLTGVSNKVSQAVSALTQEYGTFSPSFIGAGTAGTWEFTINSGYYIRHGHMVWVNIDLIPSAISDSPAGTLTLTGLPYKVAATPTTQFLQVMASGMDWGVGKTTVQIALNSGATTGDMYGSWDDAAWAAIDAGAVSVADEIRIQGWYKMTPQEIAPPE